MQFNPELIKEDPVNFNPGQCRFQIVDAEETQSKRGNDMIKIRVKLTNDHGQSISVNDYFVAQDNCLWKVAQFCEATCLTAPMESGDFGAGQCIGTQGTCETAYETGLDGNDYIKVGKYHKKSATKPQAPADVAPEFDDDVPF